MVFGEDRAGGVAVNGHTAVFRQVVQQELRHGTRGRIGRVHLAVLLLEQAQGLVRGGGALPFEKQRAVPHARRCHPRERLGMHTRANAGFSLAGHDVVEPGDLFHRLVDKFDELEHLSRHLRREVGHAAAGAQVHKPGGSELGVLLVVDAFATAERQQLVHLKAHHALRVVVEGRQQGLRLCQVDDLRLAPNQSRHTVRLDE